ncbi:MAG TPA: LCP family protein, partial [Acidimicrobiales bacterium]|nr:LCP family protein [Acidimicrobiales bacterium]
GDYYYLNSLVKRVPVGQEVKARNHQEDILLVGSTSRCQLKHQNKAYGYCSQNAGINSDVVMIVHLNFTTHAVTLLSVPRDTFVPNARTTGANKIDAALYDGPTQLVSVLRNDFGVPVTHFVELNFDSFASVVDAIGGIDMYFPMEIFDAESGLNIRVTGCHHLDGYHALQVVRARHLQIKMGGATFSHSTWPQEGLSDLARIRRDHEFLRVLGAAVKAKGLGNPLVDQSLASAVAHNLTVDSSFSLGEMLNLASTFHSVSVAGVPQLTVPVVLVELGSYLYQGYYYGDVEFPLQPADATVVDQFLQLSRSDNTLTGKALPAPSTISVTVRDGSNEPPRSASVLHGLSRAGFRATAAAAVAPVGKREETIVYHASNSAASIGDAEAVLHELSGPAVMAIGPTTGGADVTVVTGSDVVTPATAPATTTTTATARTTSTTHSSSALQRDHAFSAPTAATQALEPWDPRSCGPHGTEGP